MISGPEADKFLDAEGNPTCTYNIDAAYVTDVLGISLEEYAVNGVDTTAAVFPFRYDTESAGGYCLPNLDESFAALKETGQKVVDYFYTDLIGEYGASAIGDVFLTWPVILCSIFTALIFGYVFLFLMRLLSGLIIWGFIATVILCTILGGYFVHTYAATREENDSYNTWLQYAAYVIWGLAALEFLCVCCCRQAISLAIAVYKTAAQYVGDNLKVLFIPLMSWFVLGLWSFIWIASAIFVFSVGEPQQREGSLSFMTEIKWNDTTRYIFWYQIFGLFWVAAFINGLCQFIVAASTCIWYFSINSDSQGKGTIGKAFRWGFRFHMGTIAFGAFCIAVIQTIRLLFEWYRRALAKSTGENKCVKALICMTGYCLYILEKCVKYISKNAYIQTALTNKSFCSAAWSAFALILANAARFGWANTVGSILNFFGILAISSVNALGAYVFLINTDYFEVTSPVAPVVCVGILSLFIANTFISIFGFSSDAILQSFLLDEQLRFAGANRPEHMAHLATTFGKKSSSCC